MSHIALESICHSYAGGEEVLHDISFAVPEASVVGLAGANGSGKSTLLSILSGLYTPDSGTILINETEANSSLCASTCRLVMQNADVQILGGTVGEDLILGRERVIDGRERAEEMAKNFDLHQRWNKPVHTLSWGTKRKLCLASALLDEPEILLLDEPFSGLDYPGVCEMRNLMGVGRNNGLTQIVAAHDLECFADMMDLLVVLNKGRVAAVGKPAEIMDGIAKFGVRPPCSWLHGLGIQPWD